VEEADMSEIQLWSQSLTNSTMHLLNSVFFGTTVAEYDQNASAELNRWDQYAEARCWVVVGIRKLNFYRLDVFCYCFKQS
jgi:hypothetical protein